MTTNNLFPQAFEQSTSMLRAVPHSAPHMRQGYLLSTVALRDVTANTGDYLTRNEEGTPYLQTGTLLAVLSATATTLGIDHRPAFGEHERPAIAIEGHGNGVAVLVTPWDALLQNMTPAEGLRAGAEPVVDVGMPFTEAIAGADRSRPGKGVRIDVLNVDTRRVGAWYLFRADHGVQSTLAPAQVRLVAARVAAMYREGEHLLRG